MAKRTYEIDSVVKKNDDIEIEITGMTSEGAGVGRISGFAVFVPYALVGEKVLVHIVKVNSTFCIGKLLEVITPSEHRQEPKCECFYQCGGCVLQQLSYEKQLEFKTQRVKDAFSKVGGFTDTTFVKDTIGSKKEWNYRNKGSFPIRSVDGKVRVGFFAPQSHRLVPIRECPIQAGEVGKIIAITESWAEERGILAYDDETGEGTLRHLVIRVTSTGGVSVTIVANSKKLKGSNEFVLSLKKAIKDLENVVFCSNTEKTNRILGDSYEVLYGNKEQTEVILNKKYAVAMESFLQVNHEQTELLYSQAIEGAALKSSDVVYDVYCGVGTIALSMADRVTKVIGIELVEGAIRNAKRNAEINGINNAEFYAGDAAKLLPELVKKETKVNKLILDPPRKGCEESVLKAIADSGVERVVYVSCNPETLARDVRLLCDVGFCVESAVAVDMFPQTAHVETVVVISREK